MVKTKVAIGLPARAGNRSTRKRQGHGAKPRSPVTTPVQKEKANLISRTGLILCRQRPTLPRSCGAGALAREKAGSENFLRGHLKSSHFGCVWVTDRFGLFGHTQVKVNGSGPGRPLYTYTDDSGIAEGEVRVSTAVAALSEGRSCRVCHFLLQLRSVAGNGPRHCAAALSA